MRPRTRWRSERCFLRAPVGLDSEAAFRPGFLTLFMRHLIVESWRHLNIHLFSALYEDTVELVVIKQQNLISFF